jgi:putative ABC transport system permease protein
MLKNFLKLALRNLWKQKGYSFLNIFGLAMGMTCSLLILLWIRDERSIDDLPVNGDRIYRIYERQYYDGKVSAGYYTPGILSDQMKKDLPEVEMATGFTWLDKSTFQVGEKILKEQGRNAGADYFRIFSYPLLAGSPATALVSPVSIAISRKMANDFFGSPRAAIGKPVRYENTYQFTVTAVFEDLPDNVSDKFDYLTNWTAFLERNSWAKEWGNNGPQTFLLLRKDANPALFTKKITHYLDAYNKEQSKSFRIELGMQRYGDVYLHSNFKDGQIEGGRIEYVRLFGIVAVFILLIACINFMNLTTARSVGRAREIGIRKVVGAVRPALIRQAFAGPASPRSVSVGTFAFARFPRRSHPAFHLLRDPGPGYGPADPAGLQPPDGKDHPFPLQRLLLLVEPGGTHPRHRHHLRQLSRPLPLRISTHPGAERNDEI